MSEKAKAYVLEHWDALVKWGKIVGGFLAIAFGLGAALTTVASKGDVHAATKDKVSEARVIEIVRGPQNPYTAEQPEILLVVRSYRDDQRRLEDQLDGLQRDLARVIVLLEIKTGAAPPGHARKNGP